MTFLPEWMEPRRSLEQSSQSLRDPSRRVSTLRLQPPIAETWLQADSGDYQKRMLKQTSTLYTTKNEFIFLFLSESELNRLTKLLSRTNNWGKMWRTWSPLFCDSLAARSWASFSFRFSSSMHVSRNDCNSRWTCDAFDFSSSFLKQSWKGILSSRNSESINYVIPIAFGKVRVLLIGMIKSLITISVTKVIHIKIIWGLLWAHITLVLITRSWSVHLLTFLFCLSSVCCKFSISISFSDRSFFVLASWFSISFTLPSWNNTF